MLYFIIGDAMNEKGFAVTTVIYAIIILLSLITLSALGILSSGYNNQKNFVNDIQEILTECIEESRC